MTHKEIAKDFLKLAARGDSRQAFKQYAGQNLIHHNAYFKGDGETLMLAMEESARENPDKVFEILRALEDGNLVAVHSHIRQNSEDLDVAMIHIFCFEEGKIAELWDFGQAVPPNRVNENCMF